MLKKRLISLLLSTVLLVSLLPVGAQAASTTLGDTTYTVVSTAQ